MLRVFPFIGLVFDPAVVGSLDRVTAPPYDVIGDAAERAYLKASPYNVVRLDHAQRRGSAEGYEEAGDLLRSWRRKRALVPHPEAYFAYEMRFQLDGNDRRIRGVFGALELESWGADVIPHERTVPGPVEDRLLLMRSTACNVSAVYGAVAGPCPMLGDLLDDVTAKRAPLAATDEEGVQHRMWPVPVRMPITDWLAGESLLIVDGHHRYETALQYRDERRARSGSGPWDRVLALVVDAGSEQLPVLPYHRIVRRTVPSSVAMGRRVLDRATMLAELDDERLIVGVGSLADGALVHQVLALEGDPPAVRALHEQVLRPDLVLDDELRFTPDAALAEDAIRRGEASTAFFLPSTSTERIRAVIARGERLPQKSTFFWPKPRTGMVMRPLG